MFRRPNGMVGRRSLVFYLHQSRRCADALKIKASFLCVSFPNGCFGSRHQHLQAKVYYPRLHFLDERTETVVVFLEGKFKIARVFLESIRQCSSENFRQSDTVSEIMENVSSFKDKGSTPPK